ncbi:MAG: acyl-CoA dehydrogenase [Candidatus Muproteobacteria bacterium RIFCSPHIGHO2_12_FULL_60_33]|uniref:Acyl-coenzyme A dehydrogenase n=1 Tax=Candidatus Muproteobacteria bacterium RIFCSPLOWO2_01_FULL_60_18 TaxID=1817768 RepID=A0A1F6TWX9_9PROT|nr:MAG: acyl-CoA dehydrogenase [Candidatus Muproteobacteria bacterium RIFCSPLOWO2_01_FULL_60_18]OGI55289.1 MAG: acyl-CoA dehydrogenase [Candidatus Muproteobacteria bacterium RIFCSPHIGHO2_02_FULL_60_13]OGI56700.1 MAG: acyl-CoA dehydrogenase [Candidatus Muproteobacteria bacterium RIFCSPHIGHO2_12_FULL_60_33]OGI57932.1 MAG: acyl-CoA dehydrogenase [Candidatus Muproteobacteria bacterium RIFCSPHIGHO2_01_FULL_61_200]
MNTVVWILIAVVAVWGLALQRVPGLVWATALASGIALWDILAQPPTPLWFAAWSLFLVIVLPLAVTPLRRALISAPLLRVFKRIMPAMSDTEREALEAGTVWWEAELFGGDPDWDQLFNLPQPSLSEEEQAFLDGPVEKLCAMLDDWDITHEQRDLPPKVWRFMKDKGFFGMIIPKQYGGLEFSAQAHSAVVVKIASRSITAAVTVMVPNSLGPAELLLHYGTEQQKKHYLPRLARGTEVPCFALTGPEAGSDAGSMPDRGVVCRGTFRGKNNVLGIRLNWEKRYITLGPVATVLGLAFRLFDPDNLLGSEEDLGITLALIPTDTPGVKIGTRHNPLNIAFQNGPNWGENVFIPLDWVIGGREGMGQGWRMLMQSLAAGRSISLPALSVGAGKLACRATGAYARIRRQFKLPIGKFEAVEEALGRMAGYTYMMDAARTLTARAVDLGEKPSVASAIVKYQLTEHMRRIVNDAMDIQGGAGICLGPRNFMGRVYQALPISITVEGANLLTRALIIYGQGAVRCHPYVLKEMRAVAEPDVKRAVKDFDEAIFGHVRYTISNVARAFWLGITSARLARPPVDGPARRYVQRLTRLSAAFALISDIAMLTLGGALKRKEKISGRFADVLSFMYLASAVIKRFEDEDRPVEDIPLMRFACQYCLHQAEKTLVVILKNFPNPFLAWLVGGLVFPAGRRNHVPDDRMNHDCAALLLDPSAARDRLTRGIYVPPPRDALGRLEDALPKVIAAELLERRLAKLVEEQPLLLGDHEAQVKAALAQNVLSNAEAKLVRAAYAARRGVIAVDDFRADKF